MKKKACFVCLKNCVLLHGEVDDEGEEEITPAGSSGPAPGDNVMAEVGVKEDAPAELHPAFLKKMTELSIMSALQLPGSFVKSFGARIGAAVNLQGPGNQKWEVQVGKGKEKNSMEFRDGWPKFAVDHVLQIGDQLTFTLTVESHFQVMVFDESGSQKNSATDAINSPEPPLQKAVEVDQAGPSVPFRNKPLARPKQKVRRRIRPDAPAPAVKPDAAAPAVHSSESELRNSATPEKENKSKEEQKSDDDDDDLDEDDLPILPPHTLVDGHVVSQRRPVTQAEKDRVLLAAKALPIANPKLVVAMARGYVYRGFWMAISRAFAKAHMPKETREVAMLNMAGHRWIVKWLHKETTGGFSGGWRGFALDHRLEEGDVCVFELVDPQNYMLLVHIFRVTSGLKEDTRDYRPTPGRSRNAEWVMTPTGFQRKADQERGEPTSVVLAMKSRAFNTPTPGKHKAPATPPPGRYKAPVRCSKVEEDPEYVHTPSSSKRGPKPASMSPDETLQYSQKAKKAKASPTTSCEVYEEYPSLAAPPPDVAKQSAADTREADLLKLGKELVQASTKPASYSSSASDEVQIVGISTKVDPTPPETCACVSENQVSHRP